MMHARFLRCLILALALIPAAAAAAWQDLLDSFLRDEPPVETVGGLSQSDIIAGLKAALVQGAERAVGALGQPDGFLGDARVRIPLPDTLEPLETALRTFGQGHYAEEFVLAMNRAAEAAVPEAGAVFGSAIRRMTLNDARRILDGPDDAATRYFRRVGKERLTAKLRPIVSESTARAGVTSAYKALVDRAGFAARLVDTDSVDIDGYVTRKALDGLFLLIAEEEKRIREEPVARTSALLRKVFGRAR